MFLFKFVLFLFLKQRNINYFVRIIQKETLIRRYLVLIICPTISVPSFKSMYVSYMYLKMSLCMNQIKDKLQISIFNPL